MYYINKLTQEVSHDVHPSLFMSNGWRKCFTDDYEEFYYNDQTGQSCWEAPLEAFDDDDSNCFLVTSDPENSSIEATIFLSPRPSHPPRLNAETLPTKKPEKRLKLLHSISSMSYSIDIAEGGTETDGSVGAGYMSTKSALSYGALYDMKMQDESPPLQLPAHVRRRQESPAGAPQGTDTEDGYQNTNQDGVPVPAEVGKNDPDGGDEGGWGKEVKGGGAPVLWNESGRRDDSVKDSSVEGPFANHADYSKSDDSVSDLYASPEASPLHAQPHLDIDNRSIDSAHGEGDIISGRQSSRKSTVTSPVVYTAAGAMHRMIHSGYSSNDGENDTSAPPSPLKSHGVARRLPFSGGYSSNDAGDDTDGTDGQQLRLTRSKRDGNGGVGEDYVVGGWEIADGTVAEEEGEFDTGSLENSYNVDTPAVDAISNDLAFAALYDYEHTAVTSDNNDVWKENGAEGGGDGHATESVVWRQEEGFQEGGAGWSGRETKGRGDGGEGVGTSDGTTPGTDTPPVEVVTFPGGDTSLGGAGEGVPPDLDSTTSNLPPDTQWGATGDGVSVYVASGGAAAEGAAPSGAEWVERTDSYGMSYFEHSLTGEVSWTLPSDITPAALAPSSAENKSSTEVSTAKRWSVHFTADGIPYYFNQSTGQSQWTEPAVGAMDAQLGSALATSPALTPVGTPRTKKNRRTSLSVLTFGDDADDDAVGAEDDPYMINLLDFTPKRSSQKKKNAFRPSP